MVSISEHMILYDFGRKHSSVCSRIKSKSLQPMLSNPTTPPTEMDFNWNSDLDPLRDALEKLIFVLPNFFISEWAGMRQSPNLTGKGEDGTAKKRIKIKTTLQQKPKRTRTVEWQG